MERIIFVRYPGMFSCIKMSRGQTWCNQVVKAPIEICPDDYKKQLLVDTKIWYFLPKCDYSHTHICACVCVCVCIAPLKLNHILHPSTRAHNILWFACDGVLSEVHRPWSYSVLSPRETLSIIPTNRSFDKWTRSYPNGTRCMLLRVGASLV